MYLDKERKVTRSQQWERDFCWQRSHTDLDFTPTIYWKILTGVDNSSQNFLLLDIMSLSLMSRSFKINRKELNRQFHIE